MFRIALTKLSTNMRDFLSFFRYSNRFGNNSRNVCVKHFCASFAGKGLGAGHGGQGGGAAAGNPSPAYDAVFKPVSVGSGGGLRYFFHVHCRFIDALLLHFQVFLKIVNTLIVHQRKSVVSVPGKSTSSFCVSLKYSIV